MDKLTEVSPDLAEGFRRLREGAAAAGPLPHETVELIVIGSLVATRQHNSLRVHLRRLLAAGVDPKALRHGIVATLGAAATLTATIEALDLLEAVLEEPGR